MAYAIVGTIGVAAQSASAGATCSPAWGTSENRVQGHLLVAFCGVTAVATLPSTPSGWSIGKQTAGTSCSATIFYRIAAGSDAAPTFTVSSGWCSCQLAEFSGNMGTTPLDQTGTASGTTSPLTATFGGVDTLAGELLLHCTSEYYSSAGTKTLTLSSNRTTYVAAGTNAGTSSRYHYAFGYVAGTDSKGSADTAVLTYTTTNITGAVDIGCTLQLMTVPAITAMSTHSGSTNGGQSVTITGTAFYGVTGVTFGGTAATSVVAVSDTSITCVTPAHGAGTNLQTIVTNGAGSSPDTANDDFTFSSNTGTSAVTLTGLVAESSAGTETFTGTSAVTLTGKVSESSTGYETTGTSAVTLTGLVSETASGTETFTGTAADTLTTTVIACTSAGTNTAPGFTGTVASTLTGVVTESASGSETFTGTGTDTLTGKVTASAAGSELNGTGAITLTGVVTDSGSGAETFTGTASDTLTGLVSCTSSGSNVENFGTASSTMSVVSASSIGVEMYSGSAGVVLLGVVSADASAKETFAGIAASVLSPVTETAFGQHTEFFGFAEIVLYSKGGEVQGKAFKTWTGSEWKVCKVTVYRP